MRDAARAESLRDVLGGGDGSSGRTEGEGEMALERLQALEDEMLKCFRCNLCKMIPLPVVTDPDYFDGCPASRHYGFHSYSGSGKQIMALALVQGRIAADEPLARITYACTTCGLCDVSCKFNMDAERTRVNMALTARCKSGCWRLFKKFQMQGRQNPEA